MRESTPPAFVRLAFVGLCALPVLGILAWAMLIRAPWHASGHARQWSMALDVGVRIADVDYPRPGTTRYRGVELLDPENGRPLATLGRVEVAGTSGGIRAVVSQAEFQSLAMPVLRDAVAARLRDPVTAALSNVRIAAAEIHWVEGDRNHTLANVVAGYDGSREGSQAFLAFTLDDAPKASPAKMRIVRNRQTNPPTTGLELHTGETPLPCYLVDPLLNLTAWLGDESRFAGSFWTHQTSTGWDTEIKGTFEKIDLGQFTTDRFPHALSGPADATIHVAHLHNARLVNAQASLVAGPGQMSVSLLDSLKRSLEMQMTALRNDQVGEVTYEQLALALSLNAHGVILDGRARSEKPHVVVTDRHGPLLEAPKRAQSVLGLVTALGSTTTARRLVNVGPQTDWLLSVLPAQGEAAEKQRLGEARPRDLQ